MANLRFPSTFNLVLTAGLLPGCSTVSFTPASPSPQEELLNGTIDYPFADTADPLGRDGRSEHFVIKSSVGNAEYTIQIPEAARDYDIEIPLADLRGVGAVDQTAYLPEDVGLPQATDQELVKAMPPLPQSEDQQLVEGAFGVGQQGGPTQAPSYSFRLAKINKLYLDRQYELALVEITNLLTYYPTSAKLYKMKGTVLMKLRNFKLAEIAWARGADLAPQDTSLKKALTSLQDRLKLREAIEAKQAALLPPR